MAVLNLHHFGSPDGAPTLAIHGVTAHGERYRRLALEAFPERRWLAVDLRGHGRSTWDGPWTVERHVADLLETLDAEGVERVEVVGHSYGGMIALHLLATAPERVARVALLDPAVELPGEWLPKLADDMIDDPGWATPEEALAKRLDGRAPQAHRGRHRGRQAAPLPGARRPLPDALPPRCGGRGLERDGAHDGLARAGSAALPARRRQAGGDRPPRAARLAGARPRRSPDDGRDRLRAHGLLGRVRRDGRRAPRLPDARDRARRISSGSPFERDIGYSRAVVDGDWVFVSGTTGFDYATMEISDDVAEQAEQALATSRSRSREAGASLDDVVRVRYLLPDADDFEACWPALRRAFAVALPAATMQVCALADPRMKIEIEVTARVH